MTMRQASNNYNKIHQKEFKLEIIIINIDNDSNNNILHINIKADIDHYGMVVGGVVEWWWSGG